ncbi:monooxygenase [Arsenicicoccus piscis]|uniref:Monooxygenase n=2 Tax=Arsenicicoccus piscis TaxID=673954 RepID=A0ABQ6HT83_9MICO|nr:FAD-dependent oxidoreductase [Arsenicicoccus piscis]GMA21718.1 monooxygenase [Arsenicicoccus piscis]
MGREVTIVGGGIAGLALAATLDPRRFDVSLLEGQPGRHASGSALGMWPAARKALRRIGVAEMLDDAAPPTPAVGSLYDSAGRELVAAPGPDLQLVERGRLMAALRAAVPDSVALETREVVDAAALPGDLVVGADGVRSRVRGLVAPHAVDRVETPYVALRGIVPAARLGPLDTQPFDTMPSDTQPFDTLPFGEYWGPGRLFGLVPLAGERCYWFATHRSALGPEPLDVDAVVAEAQAVFADAAPIARTTLQSAGSAAGTLATRLWVAPPMRRYVHGRYVVMGDAAHASLPNLGRGACDAILDAVTLGETLNAGGSLLAWQARRLPLTQGARVLAGRVMALALAARGQRARDTALAGVGRLARLAASTHQGPATAR